MEIIGCIVLAIVVLGGSIAAALTGGFFKGYHQ